MGRVYMLCYVFLMLLSFVSCQLMTDVDRILKDKLAMYNKALRPVKNQSDTVNVNMTFHVIAIKDFDEVFEKLSLTGFMQLAWTDVNLIWDPQHYGMVSNFSTKSVQFWRPTLVNLNTANELNTISSDWAPLNVSSDGTVAYIASLGISVMCSVNVLYYPFDKQTCAIEFVAWGFYDSHVRLFPNPNIGLHAYVPMGPWRISNTKMYIKYGFLPVFEIELQRQPEFLALNYVLPITLLAFLNTMVFFIPNESGERISYCITVLLAIAVYMTLVCDNLPKTSTPMSIFGVYLFLIMVQSVVITLATIASLRIYFRDDETDSPYHSAWITLYMFCVCKRKQCVNTSRGNSNVNLEHENQDLPHGNDNILFCHRREIHSDSYKRNNMVIPPSLFDKPGVSKGNIGHEHKYISRAMRNSFGNYNNYKPLDGRANGFEGQTFRTSGQSKTLKIIDKHKNEISWKDISVMLDMFFFTLFILVLVTVTLFSGLTIGLNIAV